MFKIGSLLGLRMGITFAVFYVVGIVFEFMMLLKSLVITGTEKLERCFISIGAR